MLEALHRFAKIVKASNINFKKVLQAPATLHKDEDGAIVWGFTVNQIPGQQLQWKEPEITAVFSFMALPSKVHWVPRMGHAFDRRIECRSATVPSKTCQRVIL